MSQRQAAIAADVSPTTWGSLEKHHQPIAGISAAGFCRALHWTSDSIARVLAGDDPIEVEPEETDRPASSAEVQRIANEVADISERVERLYLLVEQNIDSIRKRAQAPTGAGPRRTSPRDG